MKNQYIFTETLYLSQIFNQTVVAGIRCQEQEREITQNLSGYWLFRDS